MCVCVCVCVLVCVHLPRRCEPISEIISKSGQSLRISGVSAVEQSLSQLSHLSKILFEPLSPLTKGDPHDQFTSEQLYLQVFVCVCVCACVCMLVHMCVNFMVYGEE